ncbi:MAG: hypothetical protein OHK0021_15800 [Bryobacter sp.]
MAMLKTPNFANLRLDSPQNVSSAYSNRILVLQLEDQNIMK